MLLGLWTNGWEDIRKLQRGGHDVALLWCTYPFLNSKYESGHCEGAKAQIVSWPLRLVFKCQHALVDCKFFFLTVVQFNLCLPILSHSLVVDSPLISLITASVHDLLSQN